MGMKTLTRRNTRNLHSSCKGVKRNTLVANLQVVPTPLFPIWRRVKHYQQQLPNLKVTVARSAQSDRTVVSDNRTRPPLEVKQRSLSLILLPILLIRNANLHPPGQRLHPNRTKELFQSRKKPLGKYSCTNPSLLPILSVNSTPRKPVLLRSKLCRQLQLFSSELLQVKKRL